MVEAGVDVAAVDAPAIVDDADADADSDNNVDDAFVAPDPDTTNADDDAFCSVAPVRRSDGC